MKIKNLFFTIIIFIIPITQIFAIGPEETSTFSLIVYDDWQQPSKPLPEGWSYLLKLPANLQTMGYYGESFIHCDPTYLICEIVTAHRGTASVWDSYEDFLIMMGQEPYQYYMSALSYADLVKKYVDSNYKKQFTLFYAQTGHSLGAILAELIIGSHIFDGMYSDSVAYESPGAKPIIQSMINKKQLLPDALEAIKLMTLYDFCGANAINTFNEQVNPPTNEHYPPNCDHEDFTDIPLSTIGAPGKIYYFSHYSLNQHRIINLYNRWHHSKVINTNEHPVSNGDYTWPIGFDSGYTFYLQSGHLYEYWRSYMRYMWDHNPGLHAKYKYESDFESDFLNHLKTASNQNHYIVNKPITNGRHTGLDNEILDTNKPITPITEKKRPTLYDVINNDYDGHSDVRRQIYVAANNDTKLYYAVMCGDVNFAEKLIQQTNPDLNTQHGEGRYSLLQVAIMMGYLDMVQLLLQYHANPELTDSTGNTALHTAAKERYEDAADYAKMLLAVGANPNTKNKAGLTPASVMEKHYLEGVQSFSAALH